MKQHIRLVVLEHLSHQLDIHVLDVYFLQASIHDHDSLIQFLLRRTISLARQRLVHILTMFVMMRESRSVCCCSWGLSWFADQFRSSP